MILYHTSTLVVSAPDTLHSREEIDFGKGFYLTTLREQAVKYAQRFLRRRQPAVLNTYEFEYDPAEWLIKNFDSYDRDWLDFISKCRDGRDDTNFDLVVGGIANDEVFATLEDYFSGKIDADKALGLLKYSKPNNQYCIRSQAMLDKCLRHTNSEKLQL